MIKPTSEQLKDAARILCEMRGEDPDKEFRQWGRTDTENEIEKTLQVLEACRLAGIIRLNDHDDGK